MKQETPIEYMDSLNWDRESLCKAVNMLQEWDLRTENFYHNKLSKKVDESEREHLRNCIKYWRKKLNENR